MSEPRSPRSRRAAGGRPAASPFERLRRICLDLPETTEKEAWGTPTFRVRGKMFVMIADDHHGDGRVGFWCKAALGIQEMLVDADPERFFVPPYVGPSGWVGMRLDTPRLDWEEVADVVRDGWRAAAPPRVAALLGQDAAPPPARVRARAPRSRRSATAAPRATPGKPRGRRRTDG